MAELTEEGTTAVDGFTVALPRSGAQAVDTSAGQVDEWIEWLDDLAVPDIFDSGIEQLQQFIFALFADRNAVAAARDTMGALWSKAANDRDAALECVAVEATARAMAEARVAELEGLAGAMFAAQDRYQTAEFTQAMIALRAALAKEEPKP